MSNKPIPKKAVNDLAQDLFLLARLYEYFK
jgi:hypothetical protein